MTIRDQKNEIRENIFKKRETLSDNYYESASKAIYENLFELDVVKEAKTVFIYRSMGKELNTQPLIDFALENGKRVALPRVVSLKEGMRAHEYNAGDELEKSKYGAEEPLADSPVVTASEMDLIIMPCVTCNNRGERIGYGGAFYDRFLREFNGVTVLPYFHELQTFEIPMEEHDMKMNYVITEDSVVKILK